jgi:cellulose synthase/poly-beta-1,6-N-acetylglucosamine synthase-like glycosyltransferase
MRAVYLTAALTLFTVILTPFIVSSLSVWLVFAASSILYLTSLFYGLRRGRFYREELRKSRYAFVSYALVITPLASSLFILVEEFNVLGEWYKPIMLSSFSIVYLTNFMAVPLAVASKHREKQITASMPYIVPLTVIIPAYNEEKWIGHCIEAVLEADYPSKEVIVVDDGSTDNTYEVASRYASRGVTVLRKPNGGKASALNYGLLFATGEVVVCIDADSIIGRETLKNIVEPFMDPHVVGVAGNVKVVNQVNWLTKNQALEYLTQLNIIRRATSFFGAVQVMPGPLAAFRRQQAIQVGRYDRETLTEDFDITVKLQKAGGVIQAPSNAYAYTEAPSKLSSLYRQRLRWYRGNTQVLLRHKDVLSNPRYGFLNYLIFPLLVTQQIVAPILGVLAIPAAVMTILAGGVAYVIFLVLVFSLLQTMLSFTALALDGEDVRLAIYAPYAVVGYKHLLDIFAVKAVFDILVLRRRPRWTRAEKVGLEAVSSA